jgi:hypothetical protein
MTDHSAASSRQLAPAAYLVAFALVFIPLFDAAMSLVPFRLGAAAWRFGAVGLLSNALMIPAIGVLIALTTAVVLGHERTQRVFSILCWITAAILLAALVAFSLDALQTRASVQPAMKLSFAVASATAAAKLLLGSVTFALFARGSRLSRRKARPISATQTPLLRRDGPVATHV